MHADYNHPILGEIISFGLGLALFLAIALGVQSRGRFFSTPALLLGCMGLGFLPSLLHIRAGLQGYDFLRGLGHVGALFIGPAYLIYLRQVAGFSPPINKSMLLYLIALIGLSGLSALYLDHHLQHRIVLALTTLCLFSGLFFLSRGPGESKINVQLSVLTVAAAVALAIIAVGLETPNHSLAHAGVGLLALIVVGHGFLLIKLPGRSPKTNYLARQDTNHLLAAVQRHMKDERPYLDEDLDLRGLARGLGLTAHQLSQLLNEKLNTNFYGFINDYRVEEAKRLLLAEPERTVLSISQAAGFNSKSAFHNAFLRITGTNPSQYRRKNAPVD